MHFVICFGVVSSVRSSLWAFLNPPPSLLRRPDHKLFLGARALRFTGRNAFRAGLLVDAFRLLTGE